MTTKSKKTQTGKVKVENLSKPARQITAADQKRVKGGTGAGWDLKENKAK